MSFWDQDKIKILVDKRAAGASCRQIAKELGCSRNMVIGKVNRLALPKPFRVIHKPLPKRDIIRKEPMTKTFIVSRSLPETGQCKWPIGEIGELDFHFCIERAIDGLPYCNKHCRMAYRAPNSR